MKYGWNPFLSAGVSPPPVAILGNEELLMDSEVLMAASGRRYRPPARGPWSILYGHQKSNHHNKGDNEVLEDSERYGRENASEAQDDMESSENYYLEGSEFEEEDYGLDETGASNDENGYEYEEESDNEGLVSATSQEAYIDIWNETSDSLSEDDYTELEEDYIVVSKGKNLQQQQQQQQQHRQQQTLANRMDPNERYVTYLPESGLNSQFHGMLRAMMLAKSLDRTLILPPITVSSQYYDYNNGDEDENDMSQQNQPWSSYFDLETFKYLTGVKVVELHDLKEADRATVASQESLKCHITCGVGSLRPLDATANEFVKQWKFDLSMSQLISDINELDELIPALKSQDKEHLLCISNAYNIAVPRNEEWDLFGRYLYFTPTIEEVFSKALQRLKGEFMQQQMSQQRQYIGDNYHGQQEQQQQPEESTRRVEQQTETTLSNNQHNDNNDFYDHGRINSAIIPNTDRLYHKITLNDNKNQASITHGPYISIHAMRGDYVDFCQQHFQHALQSCLPTTQELASMLHSIIVADPSLKGLPVYVSTNEDRPEELDELRALGWRILDHQAMGSRELLGVFGPMMMDQIFMAKARVLIGVRTNAFSRVGAHRQEDWFGRRAVFM
ncbi:hypothetical protein BGX27_009632 [Mortierella sp. AM989]|nr:hypothetical protein BGX27_009632 [Mortierella sp. AM989]